MPWTWYCLKPKENRQYKNIAVSINKELEIFIDKEPVSEIELESKLLTLLWR
jgi:biopolymer transport protein ExbD